MSTLRALEAAAEFVDRHSEDWYRSGQGLLAELRAAILQEVWQKMDTAPRPSDHSEHWVHGVNAHGEQRIIRWTTEYPCSEGVWMFAYEPNDYIAGIQGFTPVLWRPLSVVDLPEELGT